MRNSCAILELLRNYRATIASLPATPFTPTPIPLLRRTKHTVVSKVPEGHHPRGTALRKALRGKLPLRRLCGGLSEGSAGVSPRVLRGSAGFCGGPRDFPRVFGGSDPMLVTLRNCWNECLKAFFATR